MAPKKPTMMPPSMLDIFMSLSFHRIWELDIGKMVSSPHDLADCELHNCSDALEILWFVVFKRQSTNKPIGQNYGSHPDRLLWRRASFHTNPESRHDE